MHIVNEIRSEFEAYIIHFGIQKRSVILIKFLNRIKSLHKQKLYFNIVLYTKRNI